MMRYTGGSLVGWVGASWPLARLTISSERICLKTFGSFEFTPEQVTSIEPYGAIPLLASGVRINHNRLDYPDRVVFWCLGGQKKVLASFEKSGFLPKGEPSLRPAGIAIRWSVIIAVIVIWNVLLSLGGAFHEGQSNSPDPFSLIALLSVFIFATAAQTSAKFQSVILRDGHNIGEVKQFLRLLQMVSGPLFVVFCFFQFA